jgi:putative transposase
VYAALVPWGLKRYQQARDLHFITFSCYRRLALLGSPQAKRLFEQALEQARRQYGFYITGYVVMPEHVYLLVSEPERRTLARALQAMKQAVARKLIAGREHFWQARYYDFNVWTAKKRIEKLRYMHDRRRRGSGDRVRVDGTQARANGNAVESEGHGTTPPKQNQLGWGTLVVVGWATRPEGTLQLPELTLRQKPCH